MAAYGEADAPLVSMRTLEENGDNLSDEGNGVDSSSSMFRSMGCDCGISGGRCPAC